MMKRIGLSYIFLCLFSICIFGMNDVNVVFTPYFKGSFNVLHSSPINNNNITGQKIFEHHLELDTRIEVPSIENFYFEGSFNIFHDTNKTMPSVRMGGWKVEHINEDGFFKIGFYNDLPVVSPSKVFKVSNLFEMIYRSRNQRNNKTYLSTELFMEKVSISIIYAPKFDWLLETNKDEFLYSDISSLYYLSAKYFQGSFDMGILFAFEEKDKFYLGGFWQYGINENTNIYGDIFWTTRKWIPHLIAPSTQIEYMKNIGLMISLGTSFSLTKTPITFYIEALYNSDGYLNYEELRSSNDWYNTNLPNQSDAIMSQFLNIMDYDYLNMFSFLFHIRCDKKLWGFFSPELSLFYYVPSSFMIRPVLSFEFDFNLKIQVTSPVVFSVTGNEYGYNKLFPYIVNPIIEISYSLYL